jgi:hypothetical protein
MSSLAILLETEQIKENIRSVEDKIKSDFNEIAPRFFKDLCELIHENIGLFISDESEETYNNIISFVSEIVTENIDNLDEYETIEDVL